MFADACIDVSDRLQSAQHVFDVVSRKRDASATVYAKGMAFVSMYAAYEFSVCTAVRGAIRAINQASMPLNSLRAELLALALDRELNTLENTRTKPWKARVAALQRVFSAETITVSEGLLPTDGSHFRRGQLDLIWEVLGITAEVVPQRRAFGLIDELVEQRNGIAHGRKTPEEVGRSYSTQDIRRKFKSTKALCLHLLQEVSRHCSNSGNFSR